MDAKHKVLRDVFGYDSFRDGQEELISALLYGRDVFGVMPTGGGKSICYQLPALLLPGVTLVVSPLISLMKDQVMALDALGVPAAYINSSLTYEEARDVYLGMRYGQYKLIYIAPERLMLDGFISAAANMDISLIAVDEAHCISQWGQDFRPSYLRIPDFVSTLRVRPIMAAFTATATPEVRDDIVKLLKLRFPIMTVTGFDRPNLFFDVVRPENKLRKLRELLDKRRDKSGIIYCATRKQVEQVCEYLQDEGFEATRYHAGLDDLERRRNQEDFIYDRKPVMAATNAFGMGIDKSNVSYVIHYAMPKSMEAYYQEAGRAGRDGEPADCILLFAPEDIVTARFLVEHPSDNPDLTEDQRQEVMRRDLVRLRWMTDYCQTHSCYRQMILRYFGQEHPGRCGQCGNCVGSFVETDVTRQAQMLLSCVQRVRDKLGYSVGITTVLRVLNGSRSSRIRDLGLDSLTTYGLLKGTSLPELRELSDELIQQGLIRIDPEHQSVLLTAKSREVLFHGERVIMRTREKPKSLTKVSAKKAKRAPAEPVDYDAQLMDALKEARLSCARSEGVPLYVIFSNATLSEMAARKPRSMEELLQVPGVGTVKARKFGETFLKVLKKYG